MPRKKADGSDREAARKKIMEAAVEALREQSAAALTVEAVARRAGCAKGLVHYHFKTKSALFAAAAERIWSSRAAAWTTALSGSDPQTAIQQGWKLLGMEARDGIDRACSSLATVDDDLIDRSVRKGVSDFADALGKAAVALFGSVGIRFTLPEAEIGRLAAAVVMGLGPQIVLSGDETAVEGAYSAFWAGLLSMTGRA